jgi:AcrR family transcriptional regulator
MLPSMSTPPRTQRERRADTRRALLDAAVALFDAHGAEGFSLRQVAEHAGFAPPTVYLHFSDRDDLLFQAAVEGFDTFGAELAGAAAESDDPIGQIEAIGRAYVRFGLAHPVHYRLMFMDRGDLLLRPCGDGVRIVDAFGLMARAVAAAIDAGRLPPGPAQQQANDLWAAVHGIVALHLAMPHLDHEAAFAMYDRLQTTLHHGLYRTA